MVRSRHICRQVDCERNYVCFPVEHLEEILSVTPNNCVFDPLVELEAPVRGKRVFQATEVNQLVLSHGFPHPVHLSPTVGSTLPERI